MRRRLKLPYFLVLLGTFFALLILPLLLNAGTPSAKEEIKTTYSKQVFVNTLAKEVRPIAKAYGIRPSLVIGQALLESHYGQTLLSAKYNNLFARQASVGQVFCDFNNGLS